MPDSDAEPSPAGEFADLRSIRVPALVVGTLPFIDTRSLAGFAESVEDFEEVHDSETVSSSNSISSLTANDRGTVPYNDNKVWKGKVKKGLPIIPL